MNIAQRCVLLLAVILLVVSYFTTPKYIVYDGKELRYELAERPKREEYKSEASFRRVLQLWDIAHALRRRRDISIFGGRCLVIMLCTGVVFVALRKKKTE